MSDLLDRKPTNNFWIIGGAALVWNLIGLLIYYSHVTMTPEQLASLDVAKQEFITSTPMWATSAYAIAVNAGVLGSLFLLLRKSWAVPVFALSLLGILAQNFHAFLLAGGLAVWGTSGIALPAIVFVIGVALLLYSRATKDKGWLV
jgi:hypothetical protein